MTLGEKCIILHFYEIVLNLFNVNTLNMKKILVIFAVILLSSTVLMAQNNKEKEKVSGGLYVKGGLSWMMSNSKAYFDNKGVKTSYGFGAIMDWRLTNNFSLNIAAGFNNIGGTAIFKHGVEPFTDVDGNLIGDSIMHNYRYSTSYIEVPIGIKGSTNEIGYFTYFLKLGIDPMVRIKSKMTLESKENYIITKNTNLFNVGWFIGGGTEWSLAGNTRLLMELVYCGSLLDMDKIKSYKDDKTTFNPKLNIHDISLKVGIIF